MYVIVSNKDVPNKKKKARSTFISPTDSNNLEHLISAIRYLEMRAVVIGQENLAAGFRYAQLIADHSVEDSAYKRRSPNIINDTFVKLKGELIHLGWDF